VSGFALQGCSGYQQQQATTTCLLLSSWREKKVAQSCVPHFLFLFLIKITIKTITNI